MVVDDELQLAIGLCKFIAKWLESIAGELVDHGFGIKLSLEKCGSILFLFFSELLRSCLQSLLPPIY